MRTTDFPNPKSLMIFSGIKRIISRIRGETVVTEAVINDDLAEVRKLSRNHDLILKENRLGFNALDLAECLGKERSLKIMGREKMHRHFRVQLKGERVSRLLNEELFCELFGIRYISHLEFESYSLLKKTLRYSPGIMETKQLFRCYKELIESGYFSPVSIRWIDETMGFGLFCERNLEKGEYVGEYVGILHATSIFYPLHNAYCMEYPVRKGLFSRLVVDAQKKGNESRFINHSFAPNLEQRASQDKGLFRCHFFAKKAVAAGEQLTFDYGLNYWRRRSVPKY